MASKFDPATGTMATYLQTVQEPSSSLGSEAGYLSLFLIHTVIPKQQVLMSVNELICQREQGQASKIPELPSSIFFTQVASRR